MFTNSRIARTNLDESFLGPLIFGVLLGVLVAYCLVTYTQETSKIWIKEHLHLDARCYVMQSNGWANEELIRQAARSDKILSNYQKDRGTWMRALVHPSVDLLSPIDCGMIPLDDILISE